MNNEYCKRISYLSKVKIILVVSSLIILALLYSLSVATFLCVIKNIRGDKFVLVSGSIRADWKSWEIKSVLVNNS